MTPNEKSVHDFIVIAARPVTQKELAKHLIMGSHEVHEGWKENTTRKVRQIVRDLRMKYHIPIIADRRGYFIVKSKEDAQNYIAKLEREVRARTRASFELYEVMKNMIGASSVFLDKQMQMFPKG